MREFNLVYIDDQIDSDISSCLYHYCEDSNGIWEYNEISFSPRDCFESILNDKRITSANIIVIDDKLFEDGLVIGQNGKVTGEEYKLVLKKYFPFIETIVITQNDADEKSGTLSKYRAEEIPSKKAEEYYRNLFSKYLEEASNKIKIYRKLSEKFEKNTNWENVIREKVLNSLQGKNEYDELTKSDIDCLIQAFKELERQIENG